MKKLLSDYKDEKVDELIREALKKEVENIQEPFSPSPLGSKASGNSFQQGTDL